MGNSASTHGRSAGTLGGTAARARLTWLRIGFGISSMTRTCARCDRRGESPCRSAPASARLTTTADVDALLSVSSSVAITSAGGRAKRGARAARCQARTHEPSGVLGPRSTTSRRASHLPSTEAPQLQQLRHRTRQRLHTNVVCPAEHGRFGEAFQKKWCGRARRLHQICGVRRENQPINSCMERQP